MNSSSLRASLEEIQRTIAVLFRATDVVEMRILNAPHEGTVSGYYSDHEALAKHLASRNVNGYPAIYVTMNPVTEALLARSANHVKARAKVTTGDKDTVSRRWLLIDVDPVRPAGISSTDTEHQAALERARQIRFVLAEEGWPAPVLADSGNGAHLLYRIELPNDKASEKLVKSVLQALAQRFDDDVVTIDQTVFNASRITKAYGTVVRKGDDLPQRPHRLSRLLEVPAVVEPAARELLEELAAGTPPSPPPEEPTTGRQSKFDIEAFLARHLAARSPVAHDGGRKWVLEQCPFNEEHKAPDSAVFQLADGSLGFHCFHNSCAGKTWQDVRERFEGPRTRQRAHEQEPPRVLNCAELLEIETKAEQMLFEGYPLPACGATLKVGVARSGKTVLAVQEAIAIASGVALFGHYRVLQQGPVMIVEQDDPGGAASIKTIVERCGGKPELPFYVVPRLPFSFGERLLDWLKEQITKLSLKLVVLDSYTALRGPRAPGMDIVKAEQAELTRLDEAGKELSSEIEIIHHASKGAAGLDWTQTAAGSYAMSAATEAQVHLSRFLELDAAAPERLVRIRGRHADDVQLVLRFHKDTLNFDHVLEGPAAPLYPAIQQIRAEFGNQPFGVKQLEKETGMSRATAYRLIDRLRFAGTLKKRGHGEYVLAE
jgi:hypothetical protein